MSTTTPGKKSGTSYVILRANTAPEGATAAVTGQITWSKAATIDAASAEAAIRKHLNGSDKGGQYVAIPERSWQPVTVSVETQTRIKLESA